MRAAVTCRSPLVLKTQALTLPGGGIDGNITLFPVTSLIYSRKYAAWIFIVICSVGLLYLENQSRFFKVYLISLECK